VTPRWFDLPEGDWVGLMRGLRRLTQEIDAQGTWENPRRIGAAYLWATAAGVLYISNAMPTSETDGTVVGTQT
jgi:hypothetical protein